MVLSFVLLLVLFLAGLANYFFHGPKAKLRAWFLSFFPAKQPVVPKPSSLRAAGGRRIGARKTADLGEIFAAFDRNGDGFITKQELRESLRSMGIAAMEEEVGEMMGALDADGDGFINRDEFCALFNPAAGAAREEDEEEGAEAEAAALKEAFNVFDKDGDGLITGEELGKVVSSLGLWEGKRAEDFQEMIRKVDVDGDGMVDFEEFKKMMRAGGTLIAPS